MNPKARFTQFKVSLFVVVLVLVISWPVVAYTQPCDPELGLPSVCNCLVPPDPYEPNQNWLICIPPIPPGELQGIVFYAHGYIYPHEGPAPPALPSLPLEEIEDFLPMFLEAGFGVATTGYSVNGYAVEQAGNDLDWLARYIDDIYPSVPKILVGASEGAIIGTMMLEQYDHFDGGLCLCGPVGGMTEQLAYLGDFRVLFDYFFPGVFPVGLDQYDAQWYETVCTDAGVPWEYYETLIEQAIQNHPLRTLRLFSMTRAAFDFFDPTSFAKTAKAVLKYSVCGTRDLVCKAGGEDCAADCDEDCLQMPYNNMRKWYPGSLWLNLMVDRVDGDAQSYVSDYYDPDGSLTVPMVTLHSLLDPIVPYRHENIYRQIVEGSGNDHYLTVLPTLRYGHCDFEPWQVLGAFSILMNQVDN